MKFLKSVAAQAEELETVEGSSILDSRAVFGSISPKRHAGALNASSEKVRIPTSQTGSGFRARGVRR